MKGMAGPVLGHDRVPPVIDDPGGVVTQELVAADCGSLIEARRPTEPDSVLVEGLFSNVDAEHEPPTDTNLGLAVVGLHHPVKARDITTRRGVHDGIQS